MCAASYLHLNQCQIAIDKFSNISRTYFNKAQALLLTAIAYNRMGNQSYTQETSTKVLKLSTNV